MVNAAANGALMSKTEDATFALLEELAVNNDHGPTKRQISSVDTDAVQTLATKSRKSDQTITK